MDNFKSNDNCYKTSNNKYFDCPPRMSDGRHFTDYRGNCYVNNIIRNNNEIMNSFQYRSFLTNNAKELMDLNRTYACQKNCCGPCQQPYEIGTMMPPETNTSKGENCGKLSTMPVNKANNTHGNAPLSCPQWPTDLPYNLSKNNCSPPSDLFNYYTDTQQDSDVAVYRNQGGSSRSTSNTEHKDFYRNSGGVYGSYPDKNVSYLPGGDPTNYM